MEKSQVLKILHNGASQKPKKLTDEYSKGKQDGLIQAYSHAWTLVKGMVDSSN